MLSHAMAHSPGRFTKKTTLHSTAASASRDPTQTAQFSRFLLASGMTGGVFQTFGGAILAVPGRGGTPRLVANRPFETISPRAVSEAPSARKRGSGRRRSQFPRSRELRGQVFRGFDHRR